jgi:4-amino-4-deoxy-L-arabinose transferase-like glycosyltransferase
MTRGTKHLWAVVAIAAATMVWGVGGAAIQDSDEAFYAEAAREMVASGDWIVPHFNFEPRLQKPILYYWLTAATYVITGVSEAAARLWAAIAGIGLAVMAWAVGRRWFDTDTGLVAGLVAATGLGFVPMARQALPDVPLAFFTTVGVWAAFEAWRGPVATSRRWLVAAAAALGFGMLAKGPIAVVLAGAALIVWFVWERARGTAWAQLRAPLGWVTVAAGLAVFLIVALPWFVAITDRLGLAYLARFFGEENLERFATDRYNERRSPLFYVPIMVFGLLPWSVFAACAWARCVAWFGRRRPAGPDERRLVAWIGGPLAVLMASVGSQPRYVLPCLVPLAVLLARALVTSAVAARRSFVVCGSVAGGVLVLLGGIVWRQEAVLLAAHPGWTAVGPVVLVAAGVVSTAGFLLFGRRRWKGAVAVLAVAGAVGLQAFERSVRAVGRPEAVERIAEAALASGPFASACACGAFVRNLVFYTHAPTVGPLTDEEVAVFLSDAARVVAAIDVRQLARVEERTGRTFPRIAEVAYLDSAWWQRVDLLRAPDPSRVQRIVLVDNR